VSGMARTHPVLKGGLHFFGVVYDSRFLRLDVLLQEEKNCFLDYKRRCSVNYYEDQLSCGFTLGSAKSSKTGYSKPARKD
jgi:hypothetical protein